MQQLQKILIFSIPLFTFLIPPRWRASPDACQKHQFRLMMILLFSLTTSFCLFLVRYKHASGDARYLYLGAYYLWQPELIEIKPSWLPFIYKHQEYFLIAPKNSTLFLYLYLKTNYTQTQSSFLYIF